MNVTKSTETRTVQEIRYVSVENVSVVDIPGHSDLLMSGKGRVKVTKLTKGGYSVRALGSNAVWLNGGFYSNYGTLTRYFNGTALLRVDGDSAYLHTLFS